MQEPKAFASLSSGLLARKGAARPAMRPQGFGQVGSGLEDLGWNDMGFEAPKPALAPVRDADHDAFGEQLPEPALRKLVQQAFAHRRKALARSLQLGPQATPELRDRVREALVAMGHPADERAERLEPEEFRALHEALGS